MATPPARLAIDSTLVARIMRAQGAPPGLGAQDLLEESRAPRHKLAVTLLSCYAVEGRLPTGGLAQLAAHRARIERYAQTWARLRAAAPDAYLIKGPRIAACYPDGVLRAAGDLDVVIRDPLALWRAATVLRDHGWTVEALTLMPRRRRGAGHDLLMSIKWPADSVLPEPYEVELRTPDIATSVYHSPVQLPGGAGDPLAASVVALVAERRERQYTSRDLLDLTLLGARLSGTGWALVSDGLAAASLWPHWREIRARVARAGLDLPGAAPSGRRTRRQRLRHGTGRLGTWAHPVRAAGLLATATVEVDRGRMADALARAVHERLGARRLLAAGVPLFGVMLDAEPSSARLELVDHGRRLLARTPVGTLLMVAVACPEQWLAEAAAGLRAAAPW
jgi:hypothetical protein